MKFTGFRKRNYNASRGRAEEAKKLIPWGRYAYLFCLVILLLGLARWGVRKLFFIEGFGLLDAERIDVEGNLTGRVLDIKCELSDRVEGGMPLVILSLPELEHEFTDREADLRNELKILQEETQHQAMETESLREARRHGAELLAGEAITLPRFREIEMDLEQGERELSLLHTRVALTRDRLKALRAEYFDNHGGSSTDGRNGTHLKETVLYAPADGLVTLIHKQEGEVARVGEPVLEIADLSATFVDAYFKGSAENEIIVGESVTIFFENGEQTTGRITKVYPAALPLPVEFLNQYDRKERYILAEIVPEKGTRWPGILKTRARVELHRSWL